MAVLEFFVAVMKIFKPIEWLARKTILFYKRIKGEILPPGKTITLVPETSRNQWSFGRRNDLPAIFLSCHFYVTTGNPQLAVGM